GNGYDLLLLYDDRRVPLSDSTRGMAARRLDTPERKQVHDHPAPCAFEGCTQDAAVLADLVGALPERVGRHRRHRHGVTDVAGNLRRLADRPARCQIQRADSRPTCRHRRNRSRLHRPAFAVQYRWAVLLGIVVRLYRTEEHLLHVLPAWHRLLPFDAMVGKPWLESRVRCCRLYHSFDVWRRLCNRAGVSGRYVRNAFRGRDSRAIANGMVDGRHYRPRGRELHPRSATRGRRTA